MAKKIVKKKWTDLDEMTLDHLYTSHMVDIKTWQSALTALLSRFGGS